MSVFQNSSKLFYLLFIYIFCASIFNFFFPPITECGSYQDLKSNLGMIFKAVAAGQIRPQIHVRNKTQVMHTFSAFALNIKTSNLKSW